MELLTPSHPPGPSADRFTPFSSTPSYGGGLELRTHAGQVRSSSSSSTLPEIAEDEGSRREKVHVAVGRTVDKAVALLHWTFRKFGNLEIFLVHVHQPSPLIPTLLGKLPACQANEEVVAAHRREERETMRKLLLNYSSICLKMKVKAKIITIEAEQVQKGLVDLVSQYGIRKLVIGAVPESCLKVKRSSSKANYATKNAAPFCEIWFINKGKHVWTREAMEGISSSPIAEGLRSKSLQYEKRGPLCSDGFRFHSSRASTTSSGVKHWLQDAEVRNEEALALLQPLCSSANCCGGYSACGSVSSISCNGLVYASSAERRSSLDSDSKVEEEWLYSQFVEARTEAELSNRQALVEFLKRTKLEAEVVQAIRKVKDFEFGSMHEAKQRKEAEEALRATMKEQERLLEERLEAMGELQKTMRNLALLGSRVQETNRRIDEAAEELKLIQSSMVNLHQENLKIKRQKMEAEHWLERWRSQRQSGDPNRAYIGFLENMPELVEFSMLDVQIATCNFSVSFKLGEGGYGCVYKGELLDKTVAIKKLHAHNMQGPSQFQKEVQVLGKLRHPHLVTLIGTCPDAWSLVYDYTPNGSLQNHLFPKGNMVALSWKDRARIISEVSCALLFLHSYHPEQIVHGNLKPENILLDSELHCKICDFGICSMMTKEFLRCPSFRHYAEPKGAFPYADPEFQRTGILSSKSDVYSFGLVILQLLTGRSPVGLATEVRKAVLSGKLALILDSSAGQWPVSVVDKLADMGLQFCELNSRDRPELTPTIIKELQQLHLSEERPVPSFFLCPIQQEIMLDPVVAADGYTYEAQALRVWLDTGRETSPMTNLRLDHLRLIPNHALRRAIQDWLCKH
ncbi:hypothetical protein Ancab_007281 [Ancistrocladus abbreviatus]